MDRARGPTVDIFAQNPHGVYNNTENPMQSSRSEISTSQSVGAVHLFAFRRQPRMRLLLLAWVSTVGDTFMIARPEVSGHGNDEVRYGIVLAIC